jgi:hypothetical protein
MTLLRALTDVDVPGAKPERPRHRLPLVLKGRARQIEVHLVLAGLLLLGRSKSDPEPGVIARQERDAVVGVVGHFPAQNAGPEARETRRVVRITTDRAQLPLYVPNPLTWLDPLGLSLLDVIKNGVRIVVHEYDADKPAHAHVTGGGGREVRIGPNGHPIDGQPEFTRTQRQVVEHYKTEVRKLGRRNQAEARAERERRAAANNKPCDT